jgi:hypothetical protein
MQWQTTREAKAKDKWETKDALGSVRLSPSRPGHHEINLTAVALGTDQPFAPVED